LTDDELEQRMRLEYEQYLEEESAFLRELGLLKDDVTPTIADPALAVTA